MCLARGLSSLSVAQLWPHTSQNKVETCGRAHWMQMCLCSQVSLPTQAAADLDVPRKESRAGICLALLYLSLFTCKAQMCLQSSLFLAPCSLIVNLRPQRCLCNTQLVVGVCPDPASSWCEFSSSFGCSEQSCTETELSKLSCWNPCWHPVPCVSCALRFQLVPFRLFGWLLMYLNRG